MITQVNPGSLLELTGSFDLDRVYGKVVDRQSLSEVTLDGLLAAFLEDPEETVTGPIRIRIESVMISPGASFSQILRNQGLVFAKFVADDPGACWREGDIVVDLGPEAPGSPVTTIWLLRTNERLGLTDPWESGLLEAVTP